jgi:hypothetical protein
LHIDVAGVHIILSYIRLLEPEWIVAESDQPTLYFADDFMEEY